MSSCSPYLTVVPFATSAATTTTFSLSLQTQPNGECLSDPVPTLESSFFPIFALHSRVVFPRLGVLMHLQALSQQ
jgi:hypothetical protein